MTKAKWLAAQEFFPTPRHGQDSATRATLSL